MMRWGGSNNILSGDTKSSIFTKIYRIFRNLKKVCFTGSYDDLIDQPSFARIFQVTWGFSMQIQPPKSGLLHGIVLVDDNYLHLLWTAGTAGSYYCHNVVISGNDNILKVTCHPETRVVQITTMDGLQHTLTYIGL